MVAFHLQFSKHENQQIRIEDILCTCAIQKQIAYLFVWDHWVYGVLIEQNSFSSDYFLKKSLHELRFVYISSYLGISLIFCFSSTSFH